MKRKVILLLLMLTSFRADAEESCPHYIQDRIRFARHVLPVFEKYANLLKASEVRKAEICAVASEVLSYARVARILFPVNDPRNEDRNGRLIYANLGTFEQIFENVTRNDDSFRHEDRVTAFCSSDEGDVSRDFQSYRIHWSRDVLPKSIEPLQRIRDGLFFERRPEEVSSQSCRSVVE